MIKTQPIKKYIAPAIVATSIAVFSPVLIDDVSAHGGPDIEETNNGAETAQAGGATILNNIGVQELQETLSEKGYDVAADGINGSETEDGVKDLQKDSGIAEDGIVGDDTEKALGVETTSASNDSSSSDNDSDSDNTEEVTNDDNGSSDDNSGNEEAGEDDPHAPAPQADNEDEDSEDQGVTTFTSAGDDAPSGDSVTKAYSLVGTPYVFGGDDPATGLDSSGFINEVFSDKGLERTHEGMWANNGTKVDDPQPGDVVFFEGTYKDGVSHSGVYVGNGNMVHAGNEDTGVEETSMEIGYWADKYIGAKRF